MKTARSNDEDEDEPFGGSDTDDISDTRSQRSTYKKQPSSTLLLKPIKKKKISKLHLRKLEKNGTDQITLTSSSSLSSSLSNSKPSDFYLSLQNRFSKRRNGL